MLQGTGALELRNEFGIYAVSVFYKDVGVSLE